MKLKFTENKVLCHWPLTWMRLYRVFQNTDTKFFFLNHHLGQKKKKQRLTFWAFYKI
jgi:hypothetical protein